MAIYHCSIQVISRGKGKSAYSEMITMTDKLRNDMTELAKVSAAEMTELQLNRGQSVCPETCGHLSCGKSVVLAPEGFVHAPRGISIAPVIC